MAGAGHVDTLAAVQATATHRPSQAPAVGRWLAGGRCDEVEGRPWPWRGTLPAGVQERAAIDGLEGEVLDVQRQEPAADLAAPVVLLHEAVEKRLTVGRRPAHVLAGLAWHLGDPHVEHRQHALERPQHAAAPYLVRAHL